MGNPVWLEVCSCGAPTGNAVIAQHAPSPSRPRPGHRGHHVIYERLCEDGARMTDVERKRLRASGEAWRWAAQSSQDVRRLVDQ